MKLPSRKTRNYFHNVNDGDQDAINRVSTRAELKNDRICVLLGAIAQPCRDVDLSRLLRFIASRKPKRIDTRFIAFL